jgi:hypothetical protein
VAGPWYVVRRREIFDYLFRFGYTDRATRFGHGTFPRRLFDRLLLVGDQSYSVLIALFVLSVGVTAVGVVRRERSTLTPELRDAVALGCVALVGTLALASSSNRGIWFELPLVAPLVAIGIVSLQRQGRRFRAFGLACTVALVVLSPVTVREYEMKRQALNALRDYDPRLGHLETADARQASHEWARFNDRVAARLATETKRGTAAEVVVTGSTFLANTNSLSLAAELDQWRLVPLAPDTTRPAAQWTSDLSPSSLVVRDGRPLGRVIVVFEHDQLPFPVDARWRAFERAALAQGWIQVAEVPMPRGLGRAVVLRYR